MRTVVLFKKANWYFFPATTELNSIKQFKVVVRTAATDFEVIGKFPYPGMNTEILLPWMPSFHIIFGFKNQYSSYLL